MNLHVEPRMTGLQAKEIAQSLIPELQKHAAKAEELRRIHRKVLNC